MSKEFFLKKDIKQEFDDQGANTKDIKTYPVNHIMIRMRKNPCRVKLRK